MCAPCDLVKRGNAAVMSDGTSHTGRLEAFETHEPPRLSEIGLNKKRLLAWRIGQHSR